MPIHQFMTYAAIITIAAQFIFVINLFWSMFKGPKASDNPWESTTLEWTTATPPPHDNFGGRDAGGASRSLRVWSSGSGAGIT